MTIEFINYCKYFKTKQWIAEVREMKYDRICHQLQLLDENEWTEGIIYSILYQLLQLLQDKALDWWG
jgi:hypothetical protein